jgi:hypothetical protein
MDKERLKRFLEKAVDSQKKGSFEFGRKEVIVMEQ